MSASISHILLTRAELRGLPPVDLHRLRLALDGVLNHRATTQGTLDALWPLWDAVEDAILTSATCDAPTLAAMILTAVDDSDREADRRLAHLTHHAQVTLKESVHVG